MIMRYRFPGMNKVLQAAGRVIRTKEDVAASFYGRKIQKYRVPHPFSGRMERYAYLQNGECGKHIKRLLET